MKIRVPGSLLLLGEYAITLPGGKGVAFAIDSYIIIDIKESKTLSITTTVNDHLIRFILKEIGWKDPISIQVDSLEFYDEKGKKGFGSSAAVTVGLLYGLLKSKKEVLPLALKIHRDFQNGRGSGYDIMASFYGGMGLFTQGDFPTWTPIELLPNEMYLKRGDPVSTPKALTRFALIERKSQFLKVSNQIVSYFLKNYDFKAIERGRILHYWLHQKLNMPLKKLTGTSKYLGAGGEVALVFEPNQTSHLEKVSISSTGVELISA